MAFPLIFLVGLSMMLEMQAGKVQAWDDQDSDYTGPTVPEMCAAAGFRMSRGYGARCYKPVHIEETWIAADAHCRSLGAALPEWNFIKEWEYGERMWEVFQGRRYPADSHDAEYLWVQKINGNCVQAKRKVKSWSEENVSCEKKTKFVCEKKF